MKYVIYSVSLVVLIILTLALFRFFPLAGTVPNLFLLITLYFAVTQDTYDFYFFAMAGGLFLDIYTRVPIGSFTLSFVFVSVAAHLLFRKILFIELHWKQVPLLIGLSVAALYMWVWVYTSGLAYFHWTEFVLPWQFVVWSLLPSILYNTASMYGMYWLGSTLVYLVRRTEARRHIA